MKNRKDVNRQGWAQIGMAVGTLGLLGAYYVLRGMARGCSGVVCDLYIPISLLLPLSILVLVAVSGGRAMIRARSARRDVPDVTTKTALWRWSVVLGVCTLLSVAGPVGIAVQWRDNPDLVVVAATLLVMLTPISILSYNLLGPKQV